MQNNNIFKTVFLYLCSKSGVAYIIRDNKLYTSGGELVEEYNSNDKKHFPKWEPYNK